VRQGVLMRGALLQHLLLQKLPVKSKVDGKMNHCNVENCMEVAVSGNAAVRRWPISFLFETFSVRGYVRET
jgi:hypothetical protein